MSQKINIGHFLSQRAHLSPNKEGLVYNDKRFTFSRLNASANRLANMMHYLGVRKGDRVALLAKNAPEYYDMFFGIAKIGGILLPVNWRLEAPELNYILNDCGIRTLVFAEEYTGLVDSLRDDIPVKNFVCIGKNDPSWALSYNKLTACSSDAEPTIEGSDDDTMTIMYTSGTTGKPKGVELTHSNYFWTSTSKAASFQDTGDRFLMAMPLFHIASLAYLPMFAHFGMTAILMKKFDAKRFLALIPEEKVTGFGAVPQILYFLKERPEFCREIFSTVKIILVSAAPVPAHLIREYADCGIEVRQRYGLTESTGPATVIDSENAVTRAGSCGLPLFHTDVKIIKEDGSEAVPEEPGEVLLRSRNIMKGYWNRPGETSRTVVDGWLYTGDIAKKDEDGFLYIMDRKKDLIISGGENIYPAEIEDYLLEHPKVAEAGVIGYSHKKWGEAVKAVLVLKPGERMNKNELKDWCNGRIAKYKIPKSVVFTEMLPRTPSGKILKCELREKFN